MVKYGNFALVTDDKKSAKIKYQLLMLIHHLSCKKIFCQFIIIVTTSIISIPIIYVILLSQLFCCNEIYSQKS